MLVAFQATEPPIEVRRCSTGTEQSGMLLKTDGNYAISFVNRSTQTADEIHFIIRLGQQRIFVDDAGTFAPGVEIKHRFPDLGGEIVLVGSPSISCEVKSVHFADDSTWTEPQP